MFAVSMMEPQDLSVTASDSQGFSSFSDNQPQSIMPECPLSLQPFFTALLERVQQQQQWQQQQQKQQQQQQQQHEQQCSILPSSQDFENVIRTAILECLPDKCSKLSLQGELTIAVDSAAPISVRFCIAKAGSAVSSSKRKSYQPVRICPNKTTSSACWSPDSGALDLSRAASVVSAESAPHTPLKVETAVLAGDPYEGRAEPGRMSTLRSRFSGGRRVFSCNQCGEMEFRSLQYLEIHTHEVHGGYRCHVCQAKFTQRSNLQRHALKHVGFKPFQCRLCGHGYYRKDHLMRHMEVLHPTHSARENINVYLTSSQSLEYLNNTHLQVNPPQPRGERLQDEHDGME